MKDMEKRIGKGAKTLIHVAKNKTGMTELEYEALLAGFGVTTSADLTETQFTKAMDHFAKLGFEYRIGVGGEYRKPAAENREKHMRRISHYLKAMDLAWAYADGISRRMFGIERLEGCSPYQLYAVADGLKKHWERKKWNRQCTMQAAA